MENQIKCRHCDGEIPTHAGPGPKRKFYCSHTCYERWTSKVKYYKNPEKTKDRYTMRNKVGKHLEKVDELSQSYYNWAREQGLSSTEVKEYGFTFLKENPQVVQALLAIKKIKNTNMSEEEKSEYKKQYYIKNRDKYLLRSKKRREAIKQLKNK